MNTPDEIEHEGKTLVRLPRIKDAIQGDWAAFEGGRFLPVINNEDGYPSVNLEVIVLPISDIITIQATYREKKAEVYEWVEPYEPQGFESDETLKIVAAVIRRTNEALTKEHGSPEALMRKGAEQAIHLTEDEWDQIEEDLGHPNLFPHYKRLLPQLLANRPKGGAK